MIIQAKYANNDEDYAQASLFLLKQKRELHPAFTAIEMVALIHSYITKGGLVLVKDASGMIIAIAAYYHGTMEKDFEDKDQVVQVDVAILIRALRTSRIFVRGFQILLTQILEENPGVKQFTFHALAENTYLQLLYSKFAALSHTYEGSIGLENVYVAEIDELRSFLARFNRL